MVNPGDTLWGEVTKSKYGEDVGVKVSERNGKMWITRVQEDGLFKRWGVPLEAGDQLLQVNDRDVDGLTLEEINRMFNDEKHVKVQACRAQYGLYDSTSSNCNHATEHSESQSDDW